MLLRASALAGFLVVERTFILRCLASTAVAIPTDDVPPRIWMDWPGWASSPMVSDPLAVCSISGTAPSVAQSRSLSNAKTWLAGTDVYWA